MTADKRTVEWLQASKNKSIAQPREYAQFAHGKAPITRRRSAF
jgi:hypothetical protein